jgi:hypothetical protein
MPAEQTGGRPIPGKIGLLSSLVRRRGGEVLQLNQERAHEAEVDAKVTDLFTRGVALTAQRPFTSLVEMPFSVYPGVQLMLTRQQTPLTPTPEGDSVELDVVAHYPANSRDGDLAKGSHSLFRLRGRVSPEGAVSQSYVSYPRLEDAHDMDVLLSPAETAISLFEAAAQS